MNIGTIGIILLAVYMGTMLYAGYRGTKNSSTETTNGLFLGTGSGTIVLVFGILASGSSAWMFQGGPATVYSNGVSWMTICVIWTFTQYILTGYFGPRGFALSKKHKFVTLGEMFEKYYNNGLLPFMLGVLQVLALIPTTIAQLKGMGLAIEVMSEGKIPFGAGIIVSGTVILLYCTSGGFGSLAIVETVQGMIFTAVIWIALIVILVTGGGFAGIFNKVAANNPSVLVYEVDSSMYWWIGMALTFSITQFIGNVSHPMYWQRYFSAKSGKKLIENTKYLSLAGAAAVLFPALLIGLMFNAFTFDGNAENAFQVILGQVHPILGLLVGLGIMAAAMSTAAGAVVSASSIFTMNLLRPILKNTPDSKLSKIGRGLISVFVVICSFEAYNTSTNITMLLAMSIGLLGGAIFPITGVFFWKRATGTGAVAAIICLLAATAYFNFFNPNPLGIFSGAWSMMIGAVVFMIVSLLTKPVPEMDRKAFLMPLNTVKKN